MRLHPWLEDPNAVLVSRTPVQDPVGWDDFRQAARRMLQAMQVELDGENAVLKPNVTVGERYADPDTGITTHPGFVHGLVDYVLDHGARPGGVYILEDPRNSDDNEPRHWGGTGYPEVAAQTGAKLRTVNSYTSRKMTVPQPLSRQTLNVSRLAVAPNTVLINVPKMKTHNLGITTLSLKNQMGLVNVFDRHFCGQAMREEPLASAAAAAGGQPKKAWMDRTLHEAWQAGLARRLIDLARVVQPRLNVVEGLVARDGTGFNRGSNYALGLCVAGVNMVAVDSVASYLMGFDPAELIYLQMAAEAGLGTPDLTHLRVYQVEGEAIVPCPDLGALRAQPPLRVISDILGEDEPIC